MVFWTRVTETVSKQNYQTKTHIFQNNSLEYNELLTKFLKEYKVDYLLIQGLTNSVQLNRKLISLAHDKNTNFIFYKIDYIKNN